MNKESYFHEGQPHAAYCGHLGGISDRAKCGRESKTILTEIEILANSVAELTEKLNELTNKLSPILDRIPILAPITNRLINLRSQVQMIVRIIENINISCATQEVMIKKKNQTQL